MIDHDALTATVRAHRSSGTQGPWMATMHDPEADQDPYDTVLADAGMMGVSPIAFIPHFWSAHWTDANRIAKLPDLEASYLDLYDEVKRLRAERDAGKRTVPAGQTPLDDKLNHRFLDVIREGEAARDAGTVSPYHGHSLEHCLHATGWVSRDLRLALNESRARTEKAEAERDALQDALNEEELEGSHQRSELRKDLAALRKAADALAGFAEHDPVCEHLSGMGIAVCTCGLDDALAAYHATKGGE